MVVDLVHGALYVAEAGRGGPCLDPGHRPLRGFTSSITNPAFPADARGQVVRLRTH